MTDDDLRQRFCASLTQHVLGQSASQPSTECKLVLNGHVISARRSGSRLLTVQMTDKDTPNTFSVTRSQRDETWVCIEEGDAVPVEVAAKGIAETFLRHAKNPPPPRSTES